MRNFDLTPLFRSSIGFDHIPSMLDAATRGEQNTGYPPYNIEVTDEDNYRISLAIAGFNEDEVSIETENNTLKVSGTKTASAQDRKYLHRGIAARNFERRYQLADHVKVTGANLENGLLHIDLHREIPDAMKPRKIKIQSGTVANLVDRKAS
ncbi:MAG: Hsp20 family protein [Thiohalomonadales bacterium]